MACPQGSELTKCRHTLPTCSPASWRGHPLWEPEQRDPACPWVPKTPPCSQKGRQGRCSQARTLSIHTGQWLSLRRTHPHRWSWNCCPVPVGDIWDSLPLLTAPPPKNPAPILKSELPNVCSPGVQSPTASLLAQELGSAQAARLFLGCLPLEQTHVGTTAFLLRLNQVSGTGPGVRVT